MLTPFSPKRFGAYWLVEQLGEGGMGSVYLARREGIAGADRLCVVKTMRAVHAHSSTHLTRFVEEARVATRLNHRNICTVFDVGIVGDEHYLAMDVVNGVDVGTLFHRLQDRGKKLPAHVALYLACETLEALDYAHRLTDPVTGRSLQIVHRDVSPHNLMVTFEGEVKLIDFGLARSSMRDAGDNPTGEHMIVGKLRYMAPEQAKGEHVDGRADQFSTAVMLVELLIGERFFEGVDDKRLIPLVLWGSHRPAALDRINSPLRELLRRALDADPARRFATCRELLVALDDLPARREPGASRALCAILDAELDDEKRALRARLAIGSGRLGGGGPIDPSARTVVKNAPAPPALADAATRVNVPFNADVATEVEDAAAGSSTADSVFTEKVGRADGARVIPLEEPVETEVRPAPSPTLLPTMSTLEPTMPSPASSSAVPKSVATPVVVAEPRRSGRLLAGAAALVLVAGAGAFAVHAWRAASAGADAGVVATAPRDAGAVDVATADHATFDAGTFDAGTFDVATADDDADDAGTFDDADDDADETDAVVAARPAAARPPRPEHREHARAPPPPPKGDLKDTLVYLERSCTKRVRCAAPLLAKRARLATMSGSEIMRVVGEADDCARRCAKR